jgi:hypothetical protein
MPSAVADATFEGRLVVTRSVIPDFIWTTKLSCVSVSKSNYTFHSVNAWLAYQRFSGINLGQLSCHCEKTVTKFLMLKEGSGNYISVKHE